MKLLQQIRTWGPTVLLMLMLGVTTASIRSCQKAQAELTAQNVLTGALVRLSDSTTARLAEAQGDRDTYQGLYEAEHQLNGKLVAGIRVTVPRRDTLVVHDTLPTQVASDSTRTATFRDSTFAGMLEGKITAPPCCVALKLQYTLTRPEFSPSVGIVKVGSRYAAVVSWQGEKAEVQTAFTDIPAPEPRFQSFVDLSAELLSEKHPLTVQAGSTMRVWKDLHLLGRIDQRFESGERPWYQVGLRYRF